MSTLITTQQHHVIDIEQELPRRSSGEVSDDDDEESVCCSDEENERCTRVVTEDGVNGSLNSEKRSFSSSSTSCLSECSVDLERENVGAVIGETKISLHLSKVERDCRICHLSLDGSNPESGFPIELGCSCKEDLAAAHKHCAEAWFKIRGNKICEICGSTARNVVGVSEVELMEQWNETNDATATAPPPHPAETRHFWQGHRFLNFLLACMVFAFVISWLFHFNVPS
ncbi:hypothetical protein BVRB_2g024600 [Beta vulgaris subsp. vulgaris]|uniref:uncharacterized protein LOC104903962 n=1 Tax=Beta vulgaris subsp. vulgaris TaxID=3555 RepID=UPI00053FC199|nr:uncharacterized protein LOC104903962 [Beta vulgaris subsp. vulgaris]KMT18298.1 hypothetical protein BVRB_2g024600 [Beta vulgaris subsp. vulgaris]